MMRKRSPCVCQAGRVRASAVTRTARAERSQRDDFEEAGLKTSSERLQGFAGATERPADAVANWLVSDENTAQPEVRERSSTGGPGEFST